MHSDELFGIAKEYLDNLDLVKKFPSCGFAKFKNDSEKLLRRTVKEWEMKKRISVQSAKAKGRRLQQWMMRKISELTGIPCGKDELIASREMGQSGTDVRLIGKAQKMFPWAVECKYQETWSIPKWIVQAKENQKKGTNWMLVVKRNQHEPIIILDADIFFSLLQTPQLTRKEPNLILKKKKLTLKRKEVK